VYLRYILYVYVIFTREIHANMTTLKPVIRLGEKNSQDKFNIKIRVGHQAKTRYISTDFWLFKDQFINKKGIVNIKTHPNAAYLNIELSNIIISYERKMLDIDPDININDLVKLLKGPDKSKEPDFFVYVNELIKKLRSINKKTSADLYYFTLVTIKKFTGSDSLLFKNIDYKWLSDFEHYLRLGGLKTNSISVYLRNIRTAFNKAINDEIIGLELYPFRRFKIKSEKTRKRNLLINQISTLKLVKLDNNEEYARDIFMLSFYLIGINPIDLYDLNKTDIVNKRLVYRRAKTNRIYDIALLPEALKIINKYPGQNKLLKCADIYSDVYNFRKSTNKFLKRIAANLDLDTKITLYYARHSWATIAGKLDIPKDTISHALGHGNDTVTDVYIDFDLDKVDQANRKVRDAIK